MSPGDSFILVS